MNIEQVDIDRIIEINKLVYRMARSDDMSDSSLLHNPRSLHSFFREILKFCRRLVWLIRAFMNPFLYWALKNAEFPFYF